MAQPLLLKASTPEASSIAAAKVDGRTTAVGKVPAAVSTGAIAAVLSDTLQPDDTEPLKSALASLYEVAGQKLTIAVFARGNLQTAGPFRTRSQFQSALREIPEPVPQVIPAAVMYSQLPELTRSLGSEWPQVVFIGRFPELEPGLREYAIAWLGDQFRRQRIRVSFLSAAGDKPPILDTVARLTGGEARFESASELALSLSDDSSRVEISWTAPAVPRGFALRRIELLRQDGVFLLGVPTVAISEGAAPDLERYAQLRTKIEGARRALESKEQLPAVRDQLQEALAINPGDIEALGLAAELYKRAGDPKASATFLATIAESEPADGPLAAELGHALFASGDLEGAETSLSRARELGVSTALLFEQLGRIRVARNQQSGALSMFDRSLKLDPSNSELWFLQAETANKLGDGKREKEALERGLALGKRDLSRTTALIRIYLAGDEKQAASKHLETALPALPADSRAHMTYAGFLEQLGRTDDALGLWRKAAELDRSAEDAHYAVGRLLLAKRDFERAGAAADAGLAAAPHSGRLQVLKADAAEAMGRIGEARSLLRREAQHSKDTLLLQRAARMEDLFGDSGAELYASLAAILEQSAPRSAEHLEALRRGLELSVRDRRAERAAWFASRLRALGEQDSFTGRAARQEPADGVWVRGGLEALAFIAHGKSKSSPAQFFSEYCRALVRSSEHLNGRKLFETYTEGLRDYFARLAEIAGTGQPKGNKITITLSTEKNRVRETDRILGLLGWRLRVSKQKVTLEAGEKASEGQRQETSSALAIDETGMKEALEAGKPYQFDVPFEWAAVVLGEKVWRAEFYPKETLPGGLAEALARDPRLARLYVALDTLDAKTAATLAESIGLRALAEKYSPLLYRYSAALSIENGVVAAPGGPSAEHVWAGLAGASPREPAKFLKALLEKDDGRLFAFFASLAQLDPPHQKFFTANRARSDKFYELFRDSREMTRGAEHMVREGPFAEMLREVPLDESGRLLFPGSPEVWMVAKGSASIAASSKRIRKLARVVAPEVEDEVLVRLARARYEAEKAQRSELDNFLAVVRIDAHRAEPLDEASALLLSENYARYPGVYPYFAILTGLGRTDFETFFGWAEKLRSGYDRLRRNMILGQWNALVEMICLARQTGRITEKQSTELFRAVAMRFQKAAAPGEFASASLDSLGGLLKASGGGSDPDEAARRLLAGEPRPVEFELKGKTAQVVAGERRAADFDRVLELQRVTALKPLFRIQEACRGLAGGQPAVPLIDAIEEQRKNLLTAEVPKALNLAGKQKDNLKLYRPDEVQRLAGRLRQKSRKKKVNQKEIAKLASEVLDAIEPQVLWALSGRVYAYFLRPEDVLAEDPLLVRKHEFVPLSKEGELLLGPSYLEGSSEASGKYATGSFAAFGRLAGEVATASVRSPDKNSVHAIGAQFLALRSTDFRQVRDDDMRLLRLTVRAAREWVVHSAADAVLRDALAESTQGLLSLTRRRALFTALAARDWDEVWSSVTLSDLYFLGRKYLRRFPKDPLISPVTTALRAAAANDVSGLQVFGSALPESYNCSHPHLMEQAPYEEFERYLFPSRIAERVSEFKLYLAEAMTSQGVPAAVMEVLAEPALREAVKNLRMTDLRDWRSIISALSSLNGSMLEEILERQ